MISTLGLSVKFLKKEPYSGSYGGMRFSVCASGETITAYIYPEPWCLDQTPEEERRQKEFAFTPEGLDEAITWMNSVYETDKKFWEKADKEKMMNLLQR